MRNMIAAKRGVMVVLALMLVSSVGAFAAGPSEVWLKIILPNSPSARVNMVMAYDPSAKNIVLFGGYDGTYMNDTWIYNGVTWTQLNPVTSPSPRCASAISYDSVSGKMVMFGGFNGSQYLGDTWVWDGVAQTWTQANPATLPTAVTLPMMYTDPINGHAGMVGGFDGNFFHNETWQWTGTDWMQRHPKTVLWARGAAVVANDYGHRKVVIFGGLSDLNPINTWTWNGVDWTQESPANQPPWLYYTPAAYDPVLNGVVLFGGSDGLNTTWEWDGSNWVTIPTLHAPSARFSQGLAYDNAKQQMVMFGGQNLVTYLDGTYKLVKR